MFEAPEFIYGDKKVRNLIWVNFYILIKGSLDLSPWVLFFTLSFFLMKFPIAKVWNIRPLAKILILDWEPQM